MTTLVSQATTQHWILPSLCSSTSVPLVAGTDPTPWGHSPVHMSEHCSLEPLSEKLYKNKHKQHPRNNTALLVQSTTAVGLSECDLVPLECKRDLLCRSVQALVHSCRPATSNSSLVTVRSSCQSGSRDPLHPKGHVLLGGAPDTPPVFLQPLSWKDLLYCESVMR